MKKYIHMGRSTYYYGYSLSPIRITFETEKNVQNYTHVLGDFYDNVILF